MYGDKENNTIPATFQVINFIGWKPDPKQVCFFHLETIRSISNAANMNVSLVHYTRGDFSREHKKSFTYWSCYVQLNLGFNLVIHVHVYRELMHKVHVCDGRIRINCYTFQCFC